MTKQWLIPIALMFSLAAAENVAAQSLAWAKRAGGAAPVSNLDVAEAICTDNAGNSYVTGYFSGPATFGPGEANETTLAGAGGQDIYVAKYDTDGSLLWARSAGGTQNDQGNGIWVDGAGNSYVTGRIGRFTTFADFGGGVTLTDWEGFFVAKYDNNGNALWAAEGVDGLDQAAIGWAIAGDTTGNSYVTGVGPDPTLGGSIVTVWKYDTSGALLWVRRVRSTTTPYEGQGYSIATDSAGNSYSTGQFGGTATFGQGEVNETVLTDSDNTGLIFLAKYDTLGNLLWAKQAGDTSGISRGTGVSTDDNGDAYVIGNGSTTLGTGLPTETTVTDGFFVAKYDTAGFLVWAKGTTGNGSAAWGWAIATDSPGNSYVTGFFTTSMTLGVGEANETTLISLGGFFGNDVVVAKYDQAGDLEWAKQAGGTSGVPPGEEGNGISVDGLGNVYVAGRFAGASIFGPGEPSETVLTSAGGWDVSVAKYRNDAAPPPDTCVLNLGLGYTDNRLRMDFELGTLDAAQWDVWLVSIFGWNELWSVPISPVDPPVSFPVEFPFPSIGNIGIVTTLTTAGDGVVCGDFKIADTGALP